MKSMLPIVRIFKDLHITANLKQAKTCLKGISGIYCIRHITSGKMYIGQAMDLSVRIIQHLDGNSSNIHLQHAFKKYGIANFEFIVVEFVKDTSLLTTREQVHLDWLFSLSSEFRYNICPTAESRLGSTQTAEAKAAIGAASAARNSGENHPIHGTTHTAETKAAMSKAKSGENHPMFGKTHTVETKAAISAALSGENHPMFGKTHTAEAKVIICLNQPSRMTIFVYEHSTRELVGEFPSQVAAAGGLKISPGTVRNYLANGKVWNNKYIIRSSPFP